MTEIADSLTWLKGRHTLKMGADLRWERLNVVQPPSPTGSFTFSNLFTDLPGVANTGTPLASFLLGQVQQFSIDLQQGRSGTARTPGVLRPGRLAGVRPPHGQCRRALHAELPLDRGEQPGRGLQPRHRSSWSTSAGDGSRARPGSCTSSTSVRASASSIASTDKTVVRTGYGLVWIEMAGITTPFTTPVFPFLQTVSQRTLDNISPGVHAGQRTRLSLRFALTPDAGLGQGVFSVDRDLGSGYVQQWNASLQRELDANISSRSPTSARRSPTSASPTRT